MNVRMVRYMSLVFRGTVEDYQNSGIHPSVFMDSSGDLQIYLCDPISNEIEEDQDSNIIEHYEMNGGQFVETINVGRITNEVEPKPHIESDYDL